MSKARAGAAMTTTKDRILDTTAELFKRYGYTGTGLKQIVADANAPFGSVYHHFPGGKAELGEAVIRRSGQMYLELVMSVFDSAPDPLGAVDAIFAGAAAVLRDRLRRRVPHRHRGARGREQQRTAAHRDRRGVRKLDRRCRGPLCPCGAIARGSKRPSPS